MNDYNAADLRSIKKAKTLARQVDAEREIVILNLMSSPAGRSYMHDRLVRCHIFSSSFSPSALAMAYSEGERNIGLRDLADVMQFAPDQYIQMMREANDRNIADGRRAGNNRTGTDANGNGHDRGSESDAIFSVPSDYNPGDDTGDDTAA